MGCKASLNRVSRPEVVEDNSGECRIVSLADFAGEPGGPKELAGDVGGPEDTVFVVHSDASPTPRPIKRRFSSDSFSSTCSLLSLPQVAAGHGGASILKYVDKDADSVPEIAEYVMKVYDGVEASVYEELQRTKDMLLRITPRFFGEVCRDELAPDLDGRYMRLTNLLRPFSYNPHVMDCKVGTRSFGESEVSNLALRKDLYRKLVDLDPLAPSKEERDQEACTKYRWMSFNDRQTTLQSLGFRIDGIAHSDGKVGKSKLKALKDMPGVVSCIVSHFLPDDDFSSCGRKDGKQGQRETAAAILTELRKLRETLHASEFVKNHSFIGCSLLFVAEAQGTGAGVFLIDFAKTVRVPKGISIDHRSPWMLGNHEDGLYVGIDNMVRCWELVLCELGMQPDVAYTCQCQLEDEATGRIRTRVYL